MLSVTLIFTLFLTESDFLADMAQMCRHNLQIGSKLLQNVRTSNAILTFTLQIIQSFCLIHPIGKSFAPSQVLLKQVKRK